MGPDGRAVLNAFAEPILVVRPDGAVVHGNKAARSRFGEVAGSTMSDLSTDGADSLRSYLRKASGSREPLIGRVTLLERSGAVRAFRCHGSLLQPASGGEPAELLIRLTGAPEERFTALTRQLEDLNSEIRRRRRMQLLLEESLHDRELLLRELNHRVKNNLQMLLSMLSTAQGEARHPETKIVLERACSRVAAIGAAQTLFYQSRVDSIPTTHFIDEVCNSVIKAVGGTHELALDIAPAELSSDLAAPVALMLNELITNSVKHGFAARERGRIAVTLRVSGAEFELTVADNGVGFDPSGVGAGSSGVGLVRALAKSLGGRLDIHADGGGTCCVIQFLDLNAQRSQGAANAGERERRHDGNATFERAAPVSGSSAGA